MSRLDLKVPVSSAGERLDRFLAAAQRDLSRSRLQALIRAGQVLVAGLPARASQRLRAGERVLVELPAPRQVALLPEAIPLAIVHEDEHLLVVDKPAGLVVHPGAGVLGGTLVGALLHHVRDLSGIGGVLRPGIVHRLDKGTSGLLVVAKDDATHRALASAFASREVEKEYLAVVLGVPAVRAGRIELPIGRDPVHRKRMSTRAIRGRQAATAWTVEEALDGAALLRVRIFTGRTHQIRVHLSAIGHPVAGDRLYGAGARRPRCAHPASRLALEALDRPALHAARLAFTHPASGERVELRSALPPDLDRLVASLRAAPTAPPGALSG
jgi:23S rRNA pseudouridine1911/1915/1917 synthase